MAISQFSPIQFTIPHAGTDVRGGSFQSVKDFEIDTLAVMFDYAGHVVTTEQARLNIYSDDNYNVVLFFSDYIALSLVSPVAGSGRYYVPFHFNRENIDASIVYYMKIEIANYSPSGSNFIGVGLDCRDSNYSSEVSPLISPIKMLMWGWVNV